MKNKHKPILTYGVDKSLHSIKKKKKKKKKKKIFYIYFFFFQI